MLATLSFTAPGVLQPEKPKEKIKQQQQELRKAPETEWQRVGAQGVTLMNLHFGQLHEKFIYYSSTPTTMHESRGG